MKICILGQFPEATPEETGCLNNAWELNADGACQPKPDQFELSCNKDGMTVKMREGVVPDAVDVFLLGDCPGTYDKDS